MSPRLDLRRSFRPRVEALEDRALLSVFAVDRLTDKGEGEDLRGDLRYCITQANELPGDDTIAFEVTGTIQLLTAELPWLRSNIDVQGPGASLLTVRPDRGDSNGVLTVRSGAVVALSGLTLTDGDGEGYRGGIYNQGALALSNVTVIGFLVGGVSNWGGTLTLNDSTISGNSAGLFSLAGGLLNAGGGTATVDNSTVSDNTGVEGPAGGIFNGGTLTLRNSTVSGNVAVDGPGGGIQNLGTLWLTNTTVSDNAATFGGGIVTYSGMVTLTNATVSGNNADYGGGIYNDATVTLTNATVSGNRALDGGGISNGDTLHARNTIIAGNTAPTGPDLSGNLGSLGHNLVGNSSGGSGFHATDLLDVDPLLGPLQDNGGPTLTHALLPGSPALDAGDPMDAPKWDQRGKGFTRLAGGNIDIGAFEVQPGPLVSFAIVPDMTTVLAGIPVGFYVVALDAYGHVVTDYVGEVSFASTDPEAALPAAYTFKAADGGIAYFADGVTFVTPGAQELYVFDTATYEVFGYAVFEVLEP